MIARTARGASVIGRRSPEETRDARVAIQEPATTRSGDLRKDHVLRQGDQEWAGQSLPPVSELQSPHVTTIDNLPQFRLSTSRVLLTVAAGTPLSRIPCFRSSRFSPRPPRKRPPSSGSSSSFTSSAAKVQNRLKGKRRNLWLRAHS
jgi:hypothetical protein